MALEIDLVSLKKFWFLPGGHLRFLLNADFQANVPGLDDLVEIAHGTTVALGEDADSGPVRAEGWVLTKSGWTGALVNAHSVDRGMEWLELFAAAFGGIVGRILGAPPSPGPSVGSGEPVPTAYVAYQTGDLSTVDRNERGPLWFVDERVTRYVADRAIAWAYTTNCRQFLVREDPEWCVEPLGMDHGRAVAEGLERYTYCALVDLSADGKSVRRADLWPQGSVTYQVVDAKAGWRTTLDDVRQTLLWSPASTDVAFVRNQFANSASDWASYHQPWPQITESKLQRNRPLLASFVPDVNGIQLVTAAHLERAHDLSGWLVEEISGGRFLVEAPDLAAWYSQSHPDPDVLATARSDFEGMILTPELIEANNPWRSAPGGR